MLYTPASWIRLIKYINTKSKSLTLNCGYGKGYSVLEVVNIFKKKNSLLRINYKDRRPGDVDMVYADIKKIKKILKWKPKYNDINKIISSSIKWEKSKLF